MMSLYRSMVHIPSWLRHLVHSTQGYTHCNGRLASEFLVHDTSYSCGHHLHHSPTHRNACHRRLDDIQRYTLHNDFRWFADLEIYTLHKLRLLQLHSYIHNRTRWKGNAPGYNRYNGYQTPYWIAIDRLC